MDDLDARLDALRRARIIADPRKFREYVLVPGHVSGKDQIFLGRLGFQPASSADAWALARLYEEQARERVAEGAVQFRESIPYGTLYSIVVVVRDVPLQTGWLYAEEMLRLVTPFSGFARGNLEG